MDRASSRQPTGSFLREDSRYWWVLLITGGAWLLFSIIIFRFDWTSVSSISILFGIAMLGAAVSELFLAASSRSGWRIAHAVLAVAFVVIGIVAFVHPGGTFAALAAVMSFYFIVAGMFNVVSAVAMRGEDMRWLRLLIGIVELVVGFWAAGNFGNRSLLLVVWIGVAALARGVGDIVSAFLLRRVREASA